MTTKELLLNETGVQLLELKLVLVQHVNNKIVYDGLMSSIKAKSYPSKVYEAIVDPTVNAYQFEALLLTLDSYSNRALVQKLYTDFAEKLSNSLDKKKFKYFVVTEAPAEGVIKITRKYGVGLPELQRKFRLTEGEANELIRDGFAEKYASLKLTAAFKELKSLTGTALTNDQKITLAISDFYYDSEKGYYNQDVIVQVSVSSKEEKATTASLNRTADQIIYVLKSAEEVIKKGNYFDC